MRSARLTAPILGLLVLFALLLREGPRRADDAPPRASIEQFVEAESAWNLRRVELALAAGRVAQFDRAAHFPDGADVVDPPIFAAALTGVAYLALDGATGAADAAPLDETRLADLLAHVGPLLGVLLVLAAHRSAARIGGASARGRALIAALQVALGAPFVLALEAGHLPLGAWSAWLSALGMTLAVPLLRREGELVDRLQTALFAGLVLGLALASSPLAIAVVLPLVVLLSVELYALASGQVRRARAREALLMLVTLACIAALPAVGGPWQKPSADSPVGQLAGNAPLLILLSGLPIGLSFWPPLAKRLDARAWTGRAAALSVFVAVAAIIALLPDLPTPRLFRMPAAWLLVQAIALACCLRDPQSVALRAWCVVFPFALLVACFDERGVLFAGLAGAVLVGAAVLPESRPARRWLAAALAAVLIADVAASWMSRNAVEAQRSTDSRVVLALQDLRTSTPSAGPWNATRALFGWCIAAPPALAPAVLLHARRPVLAAEGRVDSSASELRDASLWQAADAGELVRVARELGVRVLCLRSTDLRGLEDRFGRELPLLRRLLGAEPLELACERIGPVDESGRTALVIVRFDSD